MAGPPRPPQWMTSVHDPDSQSTPSVFIVDPDDSSRDSLGKLIGHMRISVLGFRNAEDLLSRSDPEQHGCIICDMQLDGISGLELQEMLLHTRTTPFIFVSSAATTQLVVQAMRNGAVGVLDMPVEGEALSRCVREALARDLSARRQVSHVNKLRSSFARLTKQEQDILRFIDGGMTNKEIAARLDVSVRTIESRRRQLFEKLGAETFPDLIKRHDEFLRVLHNAAPEPHRIPWLHLSSLHCI